MRDELQAARILEATVKAVDLPVTLKMRTGWDDQQPQRAEPGAHRRRLRHPHDHRAWPHALPDSTPAAPIGASSARSRRRCRSRSSPTATSTRSRMPTGRSRESGADGVMIGRGAYGRPWFVGQVIALAAAPARGCPIRRSPSSTRPCCAHYDAMLAHYGTDVGRAHRAQAYRLVFEGPAGLGRVPRRGQPDRRRRRRSRR